MQIAIQSMFLNASCRSRYKQFRFIHSNCARKNRTCRRRLREPCRAFEKTYVWIPTSRWTKLLKTNPKGQTEQRREMTVSQDNRIRKWYTLQKFEISMCKTINPEFFTSIFPFLSGCNLIV